MIVLPFDCPANTLRGQLKHSWLENQVINNDADDVVSHWKDGDWSDKVDSVFPRRLQQTNELIDGLVEGFSPKQVVDQLAPLKSLPDELFNKVKSAIHEAYLNDSMITCLDVPLRECSIALQEELNKLKEIWHMPVTVDHEAELRQCWENVRDKGKALHALLVKLPNGVVLP